MIALNFPEETFPIEALEGLEKALQDPNPVVRISAVGALGTVGPPAYDILVKALKIDNIALQVATINAIGSLKDARGLDLLARIAADESEDSYIQESASSALSRLEQVINYAKTKSISS